MESNFSEILKTTIQLDDSLIEEYLLEKQKKSDHSYQIFFGLLKVEIKNLTPKVFYSPPSYASVYDKLTLWYVGVGLIDKNKFLSSINKSEFLNEIDELNLKFIFIKNLVKTLSEQSVSEITTSIERNQSIPEIQLVNNFNSMEMKDVITHFRPLVQKKNNDKRLWMTEEAFNLFLERSFGQKYSLPKPKIEFRNRGKYAVVSLFYQFYQKCLIKNISNTNKKAPFIELLKNAFDTTEFNDIIPSNFKIKSKYDWWK